MSEAELTEKLAQMGYADPKVGVLGRDKAISDLTAEQLIPLIAFLCEKYDPSLRWEPHEKASFHKVARIKLRKYVLINSDLISIDAFVAWICTMTSQSPLTFMRRKRCFTFLH